MNNRILVAYASKYGSTKEIAEKIAAVLRQAGADVDALPVPSVMDISSYQAVILGSAVYIGKWMKSACELLARQEEALSTRPVWLFSSGPTGTGDAVALLDGWRLPADVQPVVDRIRPRGVTVFHGNIDAGRVNWIEKTSVKALKKPFGDFRDWDAITSWAATIAEVLTGVPVSAAK
jgi:menaquinone-dependent protoporphyrinogen oxidase